MIPRIIEKKIEELLFCGKAIVIYGARRVGKTTLVNQVIRQHPEKKSRYVNCDLLVNKQALEAQDIKPLESFLGDCELVVLDEAQNVENIGRTIKILVDTFPHIQVIATGSSAFDLAQKTAESMVGRVHRFSLYPLSASEISQGKGQIELAPQLEQLLRFGSYPEVYGQPEEIAKSMLDQLVSAYLYKDVLMFSGIKNSKLILDLLQLLALQVGREVNANELGKSLGIDRLTVLKYLDLLEQCYVVFSLRAFSRNLRKEISKSFKVYFYDLGVRNSLLQAYGALATRNDVGALWENFLVVERLKLTGYHSLYRNRYFWRTHDQKEIDYLEEHDGLLEGYEFKWGGDVGKSASGSFRLPREFLETYQGSSVVRIDRSNFEEFVLMGRES